MIGYLYTVKKEIREIPGPGYVETFICRTKPERFIPTPENTALSHLFFHKHIEYKHFVADGQHFCVGMDPETKDALTYLWYEERDALLTESRAAHADAAAATQRFNTLRGDIRSFEAMPWYRRVWAAAWKRLP